jgi:hypothetical protein
MKNIIAHQFPFLLDRNTNTDETLNISLWNGIMFVEFPDGEEITFEPSEKQLDWFEQLPEPINPSPPALLTAEANFQPLHHIIPACIIGYCMLNNSVIRFVISLAG